MQGLLAKWVATFGITAAAILGLTDSQTSSTPAPVTVAAPTAEELAAGLHSEITGLRMQIEQLKLSGSISIKDTKAVQGLLASIGVLDKDSATGYYGQATTNAVKYFQTYYGLPSTGLLDQATFEKLIEVYVGNMNLGSIYFPEESGLLAVASSSEMLLSEDVALEDDYGDLCLDPTLFYTDTIDTLTPAPVDSTTAATTTTTTTTTTSKHRR